MKPTRECLIKSIESFYSTHESNKKEKTPKEKPKVKSRNHILETPRLPTNKEYPISTPTCAYLSTSNTPSVQSHTPSNSPILVHKGHSQKKKHHSKKNSQIKHNNYCLRIFLILLLICLFFIVLSMFV